VFYTGGADSSYSLQQLHAKLRYAVFVEGFDIKLDDLDRLESARRWLSATAKACGVELVVVRTNLRSHPLFRSVSWEITHISALAAVAHALGDQVHTMYVAASDVEPPWGSAPDLDRAWSSDSVAIENHSGELSRLERVTSIAAWEPVRGRLRVCWENKSNDLNCGFCEKCVRTRAQLLAAGAPEALDSFPKGVSLASGIARLGHVQHELHGQWRDIAAHLDSRRLRRAIERMLRRPRDSAWRKGLRRVRRVVRRTLRQAAG
jgi:hypothetical protein